MMRRLATVLYSPTHTHCKSSSQKLGYFGRRIMPASSRPCLSMTNVLKMKTKNHLMKILIGTKIRQTAVNLEVRRQDLDPGFDRPALMSADSQCQSGSFNNKRGEVIYVRYPAAMVHSFAQNIFVDMANPSTAKSDHMYVRFLDAQPSFRVEITCVTTTGHISTVEAEKGRTQSTALQNSKSFLGQKRRSSSDVSDRSRNSMRRRRSSRSRTSRSQATPHALGCKFLGQ
jgi:hypothetical protein